MLGGQRLQHGLVGDDAFAAEFSSPRRPHQADVAFVDQAARRLEQWHVQCPEFGRAKNLVDAAARRTCDGRLHARVDVDLGIVAQTFMPRPIAASATGSRLAQADDPERAPLQFDAP